MMSLRIVATSHPVGRVRKRIRLREFWKSRKNFFIDSDTMDVIVVSDKCIDDYLLGKIDPKHTGQTDSVSRK